MNSNLARIGFVVGFWYALGFAMRYFLIYYDPSQAITNILVGGLIIAVSILYDRQVKHTHEINAIGDYLQDLNYRRKK